MTTATAVKKDTQKLQRAIVDGLEDVKAQDIQVFNTEHLSPLFERVIVASGTSNRQTKALAASVRDAVREAGFPKPRIEGEDNGEWIIVDCGAAVAHIMQPAIRQYYQLEDIWGEKPVRLKFGAAKPAARPAPEPEPAARKGGARGAGKATEKEPSLRRSSAARTAMRAAEQAEKAEKEARRGGGARKAAPRKAAPGKAASGSTARPASGPARAPVKTVVVKPVARKAAAKKAPAAKASSPKAPARKAPAAKAPARKAPARRT